MSGRKPLLTRLTGVTLALCASLAVGCGETSDGADDGLGGSGRAGAAGAGAGGRGAGAGGRVGAGGSSGSSTAGAGSGGSAGLAGSGGSSGLPAGCPTPSPLPSSAIDTEQVIVIQSVKFGTLSTEDAPVSPAEVVVKNISDTDQIIVGGRQGWQWCDFPVYWNVILTEEDVTLAPGQTYAFTLINNTEGPWALEREGGEMGIYSTTGSFDEDIHMLAFASWGVFGCEQEQTCDPMRERPAVVGGYWTFAERIRIGPLDAGFVIVGDASRAAGYRSVPERCLVAPPNP